jgi:hypothetical protein
MRRRPGLNPENSIMEKKQLGASDLSVSKVCLGTVTFGEQNLVLAPGTMKRETGRRARVFIERPRARNPAAPGPPHSLSLLPAALDG